MTEPRMGSIRRRAILAAAGSGLVATVARAEGADAPGDDDPARKERPRAGDRFAFAAGEKQGAVVTLADLDASGRPILAWPYDAERKLVRDGSRLNQVLLLRLDPASLDDSLRPHAADGVLAFSAICTHAQCTVSDWRPEKHVLHCPCHDSEYDPAQGCKPVFGPAPAPLAALPLALDDGALVAAGGFIGRVGMRPT